MRVRSRASHGASYTQRCAAVAQPKRPRPGAGASRIPPADHAPTDGPCDNTSTSGSEAPEELSVSALAALERAYWGTPGRAGLLYASVRGADRERGSHAVWALPASPSVEEKPAKRKNGDQEKSQDYFANVGDAIRTLRDDIPNLFSADLNYKIYRDDIVFRDPRNTFKGMDNYKLLFWSLRFHGRIFFSKLYVDVKRIWQPNPKDGIIKMRWTVHGIPRVPWEAEGTFDGISSYKLDSQGKIYEHVVDNVLLRDPPVATNPMLAGINLMPVGSGQTAQTPQLGSWITEHPEAMPQPLASSSSSSSRHMTEAQAGHESQSEQLLLVPVHFSSFSWARLYAVVTGSAVLAAMSSLTHGHDAAPQSSALAADV